MDQQPPLNGGAAVDLSALRAQTLAADQLEGQRDQLTAQLLHQAQLICGCGNELPSTPIIYFRVEQGPVQGPQGVQLGMNLMVHPCCSQTCEVAQELERTAACRRKGQRGPVTLLPAGRRALQGARSAAIAQAQ